MARRRAKQPSHSGNAAAEHQDTRRVQPLAAAEWLVALLLSAVFVFLLIVRARHAGALWRDECACVQLAEMPTIGELLRNFQRESFPAFFPMLLRAYAAVFGVSDSSFRAFGCMVGFTLLAVAWTNSWLVTKTVPLVSIGLLGLNLTFLVWGTSIRGYGIGSVAILLTFGLLAKILVHASGRLFAACAVAAVLSVQLLLYNSVLVGAIGLAVSLVCVMRRRPKTALAVISIVVICALVVLPYLPGFWMESKSTVLLQGPVGLAWFWRKLTPAFGTPPALMAPVWITLVFLSVTGAVVRLYCIRSERPQPEWDLLAFSVCAAILTTIGYFTFLQIVRYSTREWYYLALLAILAATVELVSGVMSHFRGVRVARLCLGIAAIVVVPLTDWSAVVKRQTNIDIVAHYLHDSAQASDLIIVNPWVYGVSFNWYYHDATEWETCPVMNDHRIHRFDLMKAKMMATDPIADLRASIATVLKSGRRVWFVGSLYFLPPGEVPEPLPPAPRSEFGWNLDVYSDLWSQQLAVFIRQHALTGQFLPVGNDDAVNELENVPLLVVDGWRE